MEQNQKKNDAITRQEDDFGQWYTDICLKSELMDYARAKGFIVYRPYGYAIWENIQSWFDKKIKETPAQKARHDDNADNGDENAVHQAQRHTVGGGSLGLFVVARAKVQCDHGIDADTEADGDGVGKILDREHQRQRSHGVFADAGHKQAVYNVVQTVHQHGNNIGQRHGYQQRQHRFFFHKGLVHSVCIAPVEKRNELLQPRNRQGETARR